MQRRPRIPRCFMCTYPCLEYPVPAHHWAHSYPACPRYFVLILPPEVLRSYSSVALRCQPIPDTPCSPHPRTAVLTSYQILRAHFIHVLRAHPYPRCPAPSDALSSHPYPMYSVLTPSRGTERPSSWRAPDRHALLLLQPRPSQSRPPSCNPPSCNPCSRPSQL